MRNRLIIFDSAGMPLTAMDGGHGGEHAVAFVRDNLALLASEGVTGCIVVEYDPIAGGDDAAADVRALGDVRAELHARPDGSVELFGLTHARAGRSVGRAWRVVEAPGHVCNPRGAIRVARTRESLR